MSKAGEFFRKALPTVMTIVGSAATLAAVIAAAKEGPKYKKVLEEKAAEEKEIGTKEKVLTGAKVFAPAIGFAAVSIGCGIGAHCLDLKTQASIMGAYALLQKNHTRLQQEFKTYRGKIEELVGTEVDDKAMVEVKKEELPEEVKVIEDDQKITVHLMGLTDDTNGYTLETTKEDVLYNIIRVNRLLATIGELSLNDMLDIFEIDKIGEDGEKAGWSYIQLAEYYEVVWVEFEFVKQEDGSYILLCVYPPEEDYLDY